MQKRILSALVLGFGLSAYTGIANADSPDPALHEPKPSQHKHLSKHVVVAKAEHKSGIAVNHGNISTAGIKVPAGMPAINPNSPLYSVDAKPGASFDDIKQGLEMAAQEKNLNIVNKLNIQEGMKGRGFEAKDPFMIFEVCNLGAGADIIKAAPEFSAFAPCKIVVYGQNGKLKLLTYRPTYALKYFKNLPPSALKVAQQIESDILYVMAKAKDGSF